MKNKNKILIIEDEQITALFFEHLLNSLGYKVVASFPTAEEGLDFLQKADSEAKPDIVLLDIILKGELDGIECAEKLMQFEKPAIIFVTSNSDPKTKARALKLGEYPYLVKPIAIQDLEKNIARAISMLGT